MKRSGFLFGLFVAPLVPAVAKAAPDAAATRGHLIAPELLPRITPWRGGDRLTIQEIIARARALPPAVVSLKKDSQIHPWAEAWLQFAEGGSAAASGPAVVPEEASPPPSAPAAGERRR